MLLKILLVALVVLVAFGGKRRLFDLGQAVLSVPARFREGKARAEDPVLFAREVKGPRGQPSRFLAAPSGRVEGEHDPR